MGEVQDAHIGEKIKRLRSFRGMTCAELADSIGCTRPYLSAVENGRYPASTKIIRKLQQALNVNTDYFSSSTEPRLEDTGRYTTTQIHARESEDSTHATQPRPASLTRSIPFVALDESGQPNVDFDEIPSGNTDTIECPGDILDHQAFAVRVDGDDMSPLIPAGSMAFVCPNKPIRESRPVLLKLNTGEIICRLYQAKAGQVILAPCNVMKQVRLVDATDVDWVYPVVRVMVNLYGD